MNSFVYILLCKDKKYYVGSAKNLDFRITQHKKGKVKATEKRIPVELIFYQEFESRSKAYKIELWIKRQKSRKLIEQIIKDQSIKKKF